MAALAVLPVLCREKIETFIVGADDDRAVAHPQIILPNSEYNVVCDNVTLCITPTLLEAWELLFASFYVFNVSYAKGSKNTLELMQRLLFNIQDGQKISSVVSSLMLKVNRKDRVEKM